MTKYFRVKYGYSVADQVSIEEEDLQRAIMARIKKLPVQLGNSYISGGNIISITPHWHKHTGWYDWYEPKDGDDFAQIKRDCPNYDGVIEAHEAKVYELIQTGKEKLLEKHGYIPLDDGIKKLK